MTLDILDRREEFPDESLEDTARAVACTLEDVQAVVNRRKRSWKNEKMGLYRFVFTG